MQEPTFSIGAFTPTAHLPITCAYTSSKFVLLGLSDGTLHLYDVFGNLLDTHPQLHVGPVSTVTLGGGTGGDDIIASVGRARGDIRAARLFTAADGERSKMLSSATVCLTKQNEEQVVSLAIDPNFGKPRFGERIAYADKKGKVAIYTAGWFGGSEVVVTEEGCGEGGIAWVQFLLAFTCGDLVRVYDTRTNRMVCVVAPPGSSRTVSPVGSPRRGGEVVEEENEEEVEGARRRRGEGWRLGTKIYMEENEKAPKSPHGESAVSLYVTWPEGARIVEIGPHKDIIATEESPQRDISVEFKLQREALFKMSMLSERDEGSFNVGPMVGNKEEAPLLGVMPFGEGEVVALIGTVERGLEMHLVQGEVPVSVKSMRMPHYGLIDAELLTVPGGDPLVLIVAHRQVGGQEPDDEQEETEEALSDVMYVRSLTTAERVKWLLGQGRFSDALHIAQTAPGGSLRRAEVSLEDIGEQFLASLKDAGEHERLVQVLPETIKTTTPYVGSRAREKVMAKRKRRWERWIDMFREGKKLALIAPAVPTYEPCLDEQSYNDILVELSATDPAVMLEVLKTWPADVYGVSAVTKAIESELATTASDGDTAQEREPLREGLLMMYGLSGRHDETLNLLLREGSPKVYDYIRSHHLYEAVRSQETITGLYKIDPSAATEILSHAPETVLPPEAVVPILSKVSNSYWMFMYLHAVFRMDADQAPKYHNQLLKLYVEHGSPGMLFLFLRTSTHYSLDRALREMGGPKGLEPGKLANERVYVLAAMGDLNSAMDILLDEQGDTFAAIEFASDHGDTVLWERLIEHAGTHAETLAALLDSPAGGKVDPVRLIPLLSSEMRIPHLRDRLHRILVDAALERALREDAAAALHYDASELLRELDERVSAL